MLGRFSWFSGFGVYVFCVVGGRLVVRWYGLELGGGLMPVALSPYVVGYVASSGF